MVRKGFRCFIFLLIAVFMFCSVLPGAALGTQGGSVIPVNRVYGEVGPDSIKSEINVTFRLIGATLASKEIDFSRDDGSGGSEYVTWIATRGYTLSEGDTVYYLFVKALKDAGLTSAGQEDNYVKTITAPESCGGYELSEFTNGVYSGWMYTINGKHPGQGLCEQVLTNKDNVVFHYVNDYRHEIEDWFEDPLYPALGDGMHWNKWLSIEDKNPGATEWFSEYMNFAAEKGLFINTETEEIKPNMPATRAAFLTALYRLESRPPVTGAGGFTDVKSGQWYTDAVVWGGSNGIISGYGSGLFGPQNKITREQIAVALHNYAEYKGYDLTKTAELEVFSDAFSISGWAQAALKWANAEGLINGRTASSIVPQGYITYAETAAVLKRLVENIAE